MSDTASGRPWQLDDRDWLAGRYAKDGDRTIARELGCATGTVTAARRRLGIVPAAEGRRRNRPAKASTPDGQSGELVLTGSLAELIHRFTEDQRTRAPGTRDLLIARCKGWLDAEKNHDPYAVEDALLSIASAALLVHQHHVELRKA